MRIQSLDWKDPLEEEMATHSSIFAWRSPWTEEPGRLQSVVSHTCIISFNATEILQTTWF